MLSEQAIAHTARALFETIERTLPNNPSEADFRRPIDRILEEFCQHIALTTPLIHSEMTLASGRADAVFNRFVIEYERPGTLTPKLTDRATRHAVQQLETYMRDLAKQARQDVHRVAGVALDGYSIIFARYVDGVFTAEPPQPVSVESLERMLRWLSALSSGVALTPDNLANDFGIDQLRTQRTLRALYKGLQQAIPHEGAPTLVAKLFEQWRILFSEAIDYSEAFGSGKLDQLQKWAKRAGFDLASPYEAEQFFFALHTYFALLVKLIARMAVMRALMDKIGMRSYDALAALPADDLRRELEQMESGDLFRQLGIQNLLEGDFFAWYLKAWNPDTEQAIRSLLQRLGEYDPTTLSLIPEETRDLFKKLYHYLLPREVRHTLGEYYTPDWLAERLLAQLDNELFLDSKQPNEKRLHDKVLHTRFLDPACGSGTFLVLTLRRLQQRGRQLLIPESELLNALTRNVVGFDINPLAVLTARVNYLLAIADLLPYRKGEVAIPVYLADSVLMPAFSTSLLMGSAYEFPTAVGTFYIPTELCTVAHFDRFCELLEECVHSDTTPDAFLQRVARLLTLPERPPMLTHSPRIPLASPPPTDDLESHVDSLHTPTDDLESHVDSLHTPTDDLESHVDDLHTPTDDLESHVDGSLAPMSDSQRLAHIGRDTPHGEAKWSGGSDDTLLDTYHRLLELHHQGLNGLWARVLKNNFAPLTVGQFDYILGNPPWVNWEHLPDNYRDSIRRLWADYRLPPERGGGRLGAVKGDLSALMTLVVADKLLKTGGKLGFVITQSLFKTAAGAGFRRFKLPNGTPLRVLQVDDMVELNPFEGASNRTAVMVLQKGQETRYPVPYTLWRKKPGARFTYTSTLEEVEANTERHHWRAEPAQPSDPTSQWLTAPEDALAAIRKVMGKAEYEAHEGANTGGANAVYWLEKQLERPDGLWLMRNLTEGAKRQVQEVTAPLEPELLYPLLRGRDVQRWQATPSAWILIPQDPQQPNRAYPEDALQVDYPKTYAYLKQFEKELRQRSGYKQILSKREREFYGVMDINAYSFAPWKVVWTRIALVEAAVVGQSDGKAVLPQETISLVECTSESEAHYICALINSAPAQAAIATYSQEGGKSTVSYTHLTLPTKRIV